jgi:hypothetical protein
MHLHHVGGPVIVLDVIIRKSPNNHCEPSGATGGRQCRVLLIARVASIDNY